MDIAFPTLEMRTPEEHRERLHDMVTAARTVMVLSCTPCGVLDGRPMALVRTGDDSTMYVATPLDDKQVEQIERAVRVTVVVPGARFALFAAEARISRDRWLIDSLWKDSWDQWFQGVGDPAIAILILTPLEGSYWEGMRQHTYSYRLLPPPPPEPDSDGVPVEL
jgi:general stress protein 26